MKKLRMLCPLLGFALTPAPAAAHLVSSGLGPAYDGIIHVALTPAEILAVAVLALFAGRRGPADARLVLFVLPAAWLAAAMIGAAPAAKLQGLLASLSLLLVGGLLAADAVVPRAITAGMAILVGVLHGWADGASMVGASRPAMLLGAATAIFSLIALLASFSVSLRRPWVLVAIRVAGSWTAAFGILLIGWSLRALH
ncbi:MAG: HupE/UreJ family protein [Opitutaceae bacterium]|nr:HupE/UreJ family protein [Opitutaceae bacterium]